MSGIATAIVVGAVGTGYAAKKGSDASNKATRAGIDAQTASEARENSATSASPRISCAVPP